jgi:hypothetical protein
VVIISAHASTMAVGAFMMADGAMSATAGTTGLLASGAVAATGVGVGAIGATGSGLLLGKGIVEGVAGSIIAGNAASNMISDSKVNGNSKSSTKEQHGYEIKNDTKNVRHKVGVSGEKLNKNGTSRRANSQVNKLNKQGGDKFSAEVKVEGIPDRTEILNWEQTEVNTNFQQTKTTPAGQTRPKPNGGT